MSSFVDIDKSLQPVDWGKIDSSIYNWVVDQLGLPGECVIWQNQDIEQPTYPYVDLLRGNEIEEGGIPETRNNALDSLGNVIPIGGTESPDSNEQAACSPIGFTLTVRAFANESAGSNDPNQNAMKLLSKLKASLGLRTVIDAFSAAGVAIVRPLVLIDTAQLVNSQWLARGTLDISMRTISVITEKVGFVDKVGLESADLGVSTVVDAS